MKDKGNQKKNTSIQAAEPDVLTEKNKKNTSLRLDKQTLKALKIRAIEQDTSVQKLIERLIRDYLNS